MNSDADPVSRGAMGTGTPDAGALTPDNRQGSVVWFLFLMFLVSTLNMADRQIIGIVAEPIKLEFGLSDTLIGLLGGTAFALVYPPLGLPIARLADRFNRRNILAICLATWSGMTMLCGLATGFWWLAAARAGVAAGEAGYAPTTHSMIADRVSEKRRSSAFAVLVTGISAGALLATVAGAYVSQHYGWRMAFVALGVPGLIVALLVMTTVAEPARRAAVKTTSAWAAYRKLLASKPFVWCVSASALHLMVTYAVGAWGIVWFVRFHQMGLARAGLILGGLAAIAGVLGSLAGGLIGDRLGRIDRRWLAWWPAVTVFIAAFVGCAAFLTSDVRWAIAGATLAVFLNALYQPSSYALIQNVADPAERASAAAMMIFVQNLIGLGLGPLLVGVASDVLAPSLGVRSLGMAMAAIFLVNILAAGAYYVAGRAYGRTPAAAQER